MATMPPMAADQPAGTDLNKLTTDAAKTLGVLFKECAEYDPSGEICNAVGQMIHALGAIEKQIEAAQAGGAPAGGADYPIPPGQQSPMDQAAAAMAAQMSPTP